MSDDDAFFLSLWKSLRADMQNSKLYPPGTVYWIRTESITAPEGMFGSLSFAQDQSLDSSATRSDDPWHKTKRVTIAKVSDVERMFSEVVFTRSMFMDHSPGRYEWCLLAVNQCL
jgi:hypothetical protein